MQIAEKAQVRVGMDEAALILETQHGDLDAFNSLVAAYQDTLFNSAFYILGDDALAADVTQDAFISAFRHINTYHGGSFKAWLTRTVKNGCFDELRRQKRHPMLQIEPGNARVDELENLVWLVDVNPSPEEHLEILEREQVIHRCLNNLPVDFRTVIVLIDIQGMRYQEAASILQVPLGTIKSRLARGRLNLRKNLHGFEEHVPMA